MSFFDSLNRFVSDLEKSLKPEEVVKLKSCKTCPYYRKGYCTQTPVPTRILSEYWAQACIFYGAEQPIVGKDTVPIATEEKQEGYPYVTTLEVPINTSEETPETTDLTLTAGRLIRVRIKFPSGCHDMVGIRVKEGDLQLLPKNADEWIYGNDEEFSGLCDHVMSDPYTLTIEGISPETIYSHKPVIRAELIE